MDPEFSISTGQGIPYRAIGRTHNVDPRTVKSWVDKASQEGEREHWESVSRQLDIKYLEEHHRILTKVSMKLLDIVQTEPMFARHSDDAESLVSRLIYTLSESCEDLLVSRGAELDLPSAASALPIPDSMNGDPRERIGQRLWDSLLEHEPGLREGVDGWVKHWTGFQRRRANLGKKASGFLQNNKVDRKGVSPALAQGLADAAIMQTVHGFDATSLRFQETSEARFKVFMGDVSLREEFEIDSKVLSEIRSVWQRVLDEQLGHKEIMRPIISAYERLRETVSELEEMVYTILLRGRPNGTCSICPAYGLSI